MILQSKGLIGDHHKTVLYARGHWGLAPKGYMIVYIINNIIVSGEAILGAENSRKPLGGRDSAPNPAGELTALQETA